MAQEASNEGNENAVKEAFTHIQNLKKEMNTLTPDEAFTQEMKDKGVSDDELNVYTNKAGIADIVTKEDREAHDPREAHAPKPTHRPDWAKLPGDRDSRPR